MPTKIRVSVEMTPRKSFASAIDWPGWSRSGKTEELALQALASYADRYAPIAKAADTTVPTKITVDDLHVVERVQGSAGTEYGVPSRPTEQDARGVDAKGAERLAGIVEAAWAFFDRTAEAAPEELRKGPRGGGRNTSKVVSHVVESDQAYAREIGLKLAPFGPDDHSAIKRQREAVLEVLRAARGGSPLADRRWPARYAAHRIAWHALDHAWEIEDKSEPDG